MRLLHKLISSHKKDIRETEVETFPRKLIEHGRIRPERPAFREKYLGIWQSWNWAQVQDEVRALACGLAAIGFVVLVSEQLEQGLKRDLAGIDLVVGAKGSPMQILLAGVFHLDQSTGNIPLATVRQLRQQPLVAQAVPISLGDSYRGHRIVGTTPEYLGLYGLTLAQGQGWARPMQAVLGAEVELRSLRGSRRVGVGGLRLGQLGVFLHRRHALPRAVFNRDRQIRRRPGLDDSPGRLDLFHRADDARFDVAEIRPPGAAWW